MRRWILISGSLLVLSLGCLAACRTNGWSSVKDGIRERFPDVRQMPVQTLHDVLQRAATDPSSRTPLIFDVRRADEYAISHLPGARRLDPSVTDPDLGDDIAKDQPIVVYCSVGYRSSRMAERLEKQGYTAVHNLEGSIFEWANQGFPVVRGGVEVEQVHPYSAWWGRLLDRQLHATSTP